MALEINLLKSKMTRKASELTHVHGNIKWLVVFADGTHKYLYKIITGNHSSYCGSGGGYMKTSHYIYLAMNSEFKFEPVEHLQHALDALETAHGPAIWAQTQTVSQRMLDKWAT